MKNDIFCLMFNGLPMTDDGRTLLFETAREMVWEKKSKKSIKNSEFEALITTKWLRKGLGNYYGIEFQAHLESNVGETEITYIVSLKNFKTEDGEWIPIPSEMTNLAYQPYHPN